MSREPKQRAHSPLFIAGLASELKTETIPYGRRVPAAFGGDLQASMTEWIISKRLFSAMLIAAVIGISLFLAGCGKKGPPVPPRQAVLPVVKDLESVLEDDRVILTWTVPEIKEKKGPIITGFVVHKAKNPVQENECKNCPVKYKSVAEIMAGSEEKGGKMKYAEQIEKGFKYFFKVTAFSEGTVSGGRDSNIVEFIY